MQDASFDRVFLGIETPAEESLKEAQKMQNTRRSLLDSVRRIQRYGMEVMAGFIVGFDNDPEDIFDRQVDFIQESAIPLAMVGLLQALPGTQLYRRLQKEGRIVCDGNGNNLDFRLNFIRAWTRSACWTAIAPSCSASIGPTFITRECANFLAQYQPHTSYRRLTLSGLPGAGAVHSQDREFSAATLSRIGGFSSRPARVTGNRSARRSAWRSWATISRSSRESP